MKPPGVTLVKLDSSAERKPTRRHDNMHMHADTEHQTAAEIADHTAAETAEESAAAGPENAEEAAPAMPEAQQGLPLGGTSNGVWQSMS